MVERRGSGIPSGEMWKPPERSSNAQVFDRNAIDRSLGKSEAEIEAKNARVRELRADEVAREDRAKDARDKVAARPKLYTPPKAPAPPRDRSADAGMINIKELPAQAALEQADGEDGESAPNEAEGSTIEAGGEDLEAAAEQAAADAAEAALQEEAAEAAAKAQRDAERAAKTRKMTVKAQQLRDELRVRMSDQLTREQESRQRGSASV